MSSPDTGITTPTLSSTGRTAEPTQETILSGSLTSNTTRWNPDYPTNEDKDSPTALLPTVALSEALPPTILLSITITIALGLSANEHVLLRLRVTTSVANVLILLALTRVSRHSATFFYALFAVSYLSLVNVSLTILHFFLQ